MSNEQMQGGRIALALAAKRLIASGPSDFNLPAIPEHKCGIVCVQPLFYGSTNRNWDSLDGCSIFADLDVHRLRLLRVWAMPDFPLWAPSIDLTRYVCR